MSYTYDDNGLRVSKTVFGETTYYVYSGNNIMAQYMLDSNNEVTNLIQFLYDDADLITGFTYEGHTYFYIKNLQGDITNIVDENGVNLVFYSYKAYGDCNYACDESALNYGYTESELDNLANTNPIRYRGYYLDDVLPFYYLQSRYYAYIGCRFLNADLPIYAKIQKDDNAGINLFAYCHNNPVNNCDPSGFAAMGISISALLIAILSAAAAWIIAEATIAVGSLNDTSDSTNDIRKNYRSISTFLVLITNILSKSQTIKNQASIAKKAVEKAVRKNKNNGKDGNVVYVVYDKNTYEVFYVGRTKDFERRKKEHTKGKKAKFKSENFKIITIASGLTHNQSRALEQVIISAYTLHALENARNSIAEKNWHKFDYDFKQIKSLIQSFLDNN